MPTPERSPSKLCQLDLAPEIKAPKQNCAAVLCRAATAAAGHGAEFTTQACVGEEQRGVEESQTLDPAWSLESSRADLRGMGVAAGCVAVHRTERSRCCLSGQLGQAVR